MKRVAYIAVTIAIMLVISRFLVRIVDATVQIDDDIGVLILMLISVNAAIGGYMETDTDKSCYLSSSSLI